MSLQRRIGTDPVSAVVPQHGLVVEGGACRPAIDPRPPSHFRVANMTVAVLRVDDRVSKLEPVACVLAIGFVNALWG